MIEDIKVGETYNVRVTVEDKSDRGWIQVRTSESAFPIVLAAFEAEAFSPISPENGIKNTETAPKYDPCRMLKKGDRVEVVKNKGRIGSTETPVGTLATVTEDEEEAEWIYIQAEGSNKIDTIDPAYLELVTPVEELEPYYILQDCEEIDGDTVVFWAVRDEHDDTVAKFYVELYRADGAQKAAEAERDRRNAEWRKEQSNDND